MNPAFTHWFYPQKQGGHGFWPPCNLASASKPNYQCWAALRFFLRTVGVLCTWNNSDSKKQLVLGIWKAWKSMNCLFCWLPKEPPVLSWFFWLFNLFSWVGFRCEGFTKWELLMVYVPIYPVWKPAKNQCCLKEPRNAANLEWILDFCPLNVTTTACIICWRYELGL